MKINDTLPRLILYIALFGTFFVNATGQTRNPAAIFDFDGDGKTDPAVFKHIPDFGYLEIFYLMSSRNYQQEISSRVCFRNVVYNCAGLTVGDYDNDGKWDISGFIQNDGALDNTPNTSRYKNILSGTGAEIETFYGNRPDMPFPQDYDGDGKMDLTVIRKVDVNGVLQWQWRIRQSTDHRIRVENFGVSATDFKVAGDFDGDGKADPSVYRINNRTFYVLKSSDGEIQTEQFDENLNDYLPITADFDGDGKTDFAFLQNGDLGNTLVRTRGNKGLALSHRAVTRWFWKQSSDNSYKRETFIFHSYHNYAAATHGDFDGDGKTDIGYYIYDFKSPLYLPRYSHYFYVKKSFDGSIFKVNLGGKTTSSIPVFYYPLSDQINRYGRPDHFYLWNPYPLP